MGIIKIISFKLTMDTFSKIPETPPDAIFGMKAKYAAD